jgi:hypothetical protein
MTFFQNMMVGAGTIIDIFPKTEPYERYLYTITRSDSEAIRHDFEAVGRDILKVACNVVKENKK